MHTFAPYLDKIENQNHRIRLEEIFSWIQKEFPELDTRIAWNQPMFTHHGTFIIAFSVSKKHISVSPEAAGMIHFSEEISKLGYEQSKMMLKIPWGEPVDYTLLRKMIEYNIQDKLDCDTFWRK